MAPKFGTSGLRGLVTELTSDCVGGYISAFIASCDIGTSLFIGHDLRASSPDISNMVANAAAAQGVKVVTCGAVPTPALALASMNAGAAAVMITGSHIPSDRNGLKFYTPNGEITKADEQAIGAALGATQDGIAMAHVEQNALVADAYINRYAKAFSNKLDGKRIGLYAHSAVGRDLMADLLQTLGAEVVIFGKSDVFIPVDTEAVSPDIKQQLKKWAASSQIDAIISTDADGDRPLVTDETGQIIVGDILGQITAKAMGAETVVTPISSNTGVEKGGQFSKVIRTKIGSPFVIAGMSKATDKVVGYEANGGFLLGYDAKGPTGTLPKLLTRDALLPILACLTAAGSNKISNRVACEPARFTAADRLQDVESSKSAALVKKLNEDAAERAAFLRPFNATEAGINTSDGLRITLSNDRIVHLRPSGNAPELRLYIEAESSDIAQSELEKGLAVLRDIFES